MGEKILMAVFVECLKLVGQIETQVNRQYFAEIINPEFRKFWETFFDFFASRTDFSQSKKTSPKLNRLLVEAIKRFSDSIEAFNKTKSESLISLLQLQRQLLTLQLLVSKEIVFDERGDNNLNILDKKNPPGETKVDNSTNKTFSKKITDRTEKLLYQFINERGIVQNIQIFEKFNLSSRRNLKRKVSSLVRDGLVKRVMEGKKVYYSINYTE